MKADSSTTGAATTTSTGAATTASTGATTTTSTGAAATTQPTTSTAASTTTTTTMAGEPATTTIAPVTTATVTTQATTTTTTTQLQNPYTPLNETNPVAFSTWVKTARVGGAALYVGMPEGEMDKILQDLINQDISVIEADSDMSNYLSDAQVDLEIGLMRRFSDKAHAAGMRVVWYWPTLEVVTPNGRISPYTMYKEHPDWVQYGIDGTPNVFYGGGGQVFWVESNDESAWMSPSSPGYRAYFFERVRRIVRNAGLDGLWFDVPIFADFGPTEYSDTNDAARERYMLVTGKNIPGAVDWNDPNFRRWIEWRHEEIARFLQDVTTAIREIDPEFIALSETLPTDYNGATQYGLDGGYLKNIKGLTNIWEVDTMSNNVGMRMAKEDDWISFISALKYTKAACGDKPSWVFSYGLQDDDATQVMSQALIAGNNPYELKVPEMTTTVGGAFRQKMFGFTKQNSPYIFESESLAKVGILFSSGSRDYVDRFVGLGMFVNTDSGKDDLWWASGDGDYGNDSAYNREYLAEFRGFVELCVNYHIPFNTLVFPDAAELSSYDVVIMPNIQALSDAEAGMLRNFVISGGHLIATGPNPGGWDEYGNDRPDYALGDVLGITKSSAALPSDTDTATGNGKALFFSEPIGKNYFTGSSSASGEQLSSTIKSFIDVLITTEADRRIHIELSQLNDQLVLQFTNFIGMDGTGINGALTVKPSNFNVGLAVPLGRTVTKVEITSPEAPGRVVLGSNTAVPGQVDFDVTVNQYSMVIVSLNGAVDPSFGHFPAAGHDYLQTAVGAPLSFNDTFLLSNDGDLDPSGSPLQIANVRTTSGTTGAISGGGTYTYTPPAGFVGTDVLLYDLIDSTARSSTGRIRISVEAPSSTYVPNQVTIVEGTASSFNPGELSYLTAIDDTTYDVIAVGDSSVSGGYVVGFEVRTIIKDAVDTIDSMEVFFVGHFSPGGIAQEIFVYNFASGLWESVDTALIGDYDVPVSWRTDNGASYISAANETVLRIQDKSTKPFESWTNQVNWKVTQKI